MLQLDTNVFVYHLAPHLFPEHVELVQRSSQHYRRIILTHAAVVYNLCRHHSPHGVWRMPRPPHLEAVVGFRDGLKHGAKTVYWDHIMVKRVEYLRGKKHGLCQKWNSDGTPRLTGHFWNGLPVGKWKLYSSNGALKQSRFYARGRPVWMMCTWTIDGRCCTTKRFPFTTRDDNGTYFSL